MCGWKPGEEWPGVEPLELLRCVQLVACVKSHFREIVEGAVRTVASLGRRGVRGWLWDSYCCSGREGNRFCSAVLRGRYEGVCVLLP